MYCPRPASLSETGQSVIGVGVGLARCDQRHLALAQKLEHAVDQRLDRAAELSENALRNLAVVSEAAQNRSPRTASYARVSTNGRSTESQLSDLRTYAQSRNLEVTEYVDHGHSGARERRPALDRLMNDARKRKFDRVLVWRFDRFACSTKHLLLALEEFRLR